MRRRLRCRLTTGQCAFLYSDNSNYFANISGGALGSVTSITATSPLTGGTITTTGSIGLGTVPRSLGGLNSTSAGTGILRDGTTPAATELSGDCATSGSNAVICTKTNSVAFGTFATVQPGAVNPQTATYQVLAADFTNSKNIIVASGTFNVTLVASGSQPANGQNINVINYGSGTVTIVRSGQNLNGGTTSISIAGGTQQAPNGAYIVSNGTDYFVQPWIGSSSGGGGGVTSVATGTGLTGGPITTTGTISIPSAGVTNALLANPSLTANGATCTLGSTCQIQGAVNAEIATYQILAADFTACKTIPVASGTFTATLVASGSQPASGQCVDIVNYGSGVVTVATSGQNINGASASLTIPPGGQANPNGMHVVSDGTNYVGQPWNTPGTPTTSALLKYDSNGRPVAGEILDNGSATLSANAAATTVSLTGGTNGASSGAVGGLTLKGGNQTGAGGSGSQGGSVGIIGGSNAATNASSQAGGIEIMSERISTERHQPGKQGLGIIGSAYVKGATVTAFNLECESAAMTITDCGALPTNWIGIAEVVNSNTAQVMTLSQEFVNASAAVTLGHTVCAGSTAGQVTDSGGTGTCAYSQGHQVGVVMAVAGTWTLYDGTTATASTTLPLIEYAPDRQAPPLTVGTPSFSVGTGVTSVVCASGYLCNNARGTLTIVGGTATTGTIANSVTFWLRLRFSGRSKQHVTCNTTEWRRNVLPRGFRLERQPRLPRPLTSQRQ